MYTVKYMGGRTSDDLISCVPDIINGRLGIPVGDLKWNEERVKFNIPAIIL